MCERADLSLRFDLSSIKLQLLIYFLSQRIRLRFKPSWLQSQHENLQKAYTSACESSLCLKNEWTAGYYLIVLKAHV